MMKNEEQVSVDSTVKVLETPVDTRTKRTLADHYKETVLVPALPSLEGFFDQHAQFRKVKYVEALKSALSQIEEMLKKDKPEGIKPIKIDFKIDDSDQGDFIIFDAPPFSALVHLTFTYDCIIFSEYPFPRAPYHIEKSVIVTAGSNETAIVGALISFIRYFLTL